MTDRDYLRQLRIPTSAEPLRVLMSACLVGITCGYDCTANGEYPSLEIVYAKLDPTYTPDLSKIDHLEIAWYKEYFGV